MATPQLAAQIHRYTIEEYERLVALGGLAKLRVELIDGYLLDMSPKSPAHENVVAWLTGWLFDRIDRSRQELGVCGSLRIGNSEPEPDLMVFGRGKPKGSHPVSAQLVIEVALSSVERDLTLKPGLYARAVEEYWVVDLEARRVLVHRDPEAGGYRSVVEYGPAAALAPLSLGHEPMSFAELLDAA